MFGSASLELAIGLCMLYLMFGGICSTVREYVARILSQREAMLVAGMSRVLGANPPEKVGTSAPLSTPDNISVPASALNENNLASLVLGHSLVRGLTLAKQRPSYIPARTFALALLDVLTPDGQTTRTVESVRQAVAAIPSDKVRNALLPLVTQSVADVAQLQANIERHFDDAMDRVSGAYKRNSQKILPAIIAVLVTVAFNVDTLHVARALWASPTERAAIAQQAELTAKAAAATGDRAVSIPLAELPIGWYELPSSGG